MISSLLQETPRACRAPDGHTSIHSKQHVQTSRSMKKGFLGFMAPGWQTSMQLPHPIHLAAVKLSSASRFFPSGLWHQTQSSGQPLKNTTDRIPGPSSRAFLLSAKIKGFPTSFTHNPRLSRHFFEDDHKQHWLARIGNSIQIG